MKASEITANGTWRLFACNDKAASDVSLRTIDGVHFDVKLSEAWGREVVTTEIASGVDADEVELLTKQALDQARARRVKHLRANRTPGELLCNYPWVANEP